MDNFEKEKIRVFVCDTDYSKRHKHDFLEFAYVINGRAEHYFDDEKSIIERGNYFIVDYGSFHSYKKIGDEPFALINCLFLPDLIDKTLVHCKSFAELINNSLIRFNYSMLNTKPTSIIFSDDSEILSHLENMVNEYEKKAPGYIEIIRSNLIEIIILTMRKITSKNTDVVYKNYSDYIINYINDNYSKQIKLSDICGEINYSLPYISKMFKQDVGCTYNAFVQKVRIEQSCRLLMNTDMNISDIANAVGYSDIKFFNSLFKRYWNLTPGEFRKNYER